MNNRWFSAKELMGLAGVPKTVKGIIAKAKRENWAFQKRSGKGGGKVYAFASLPAETQAALTATDHETKKIHNKSSQEGAVAGAMLKLKATAAETVDENAREQSLADASLLQGNARSRMDARIAIMQAFDAWKMSHEGSVSVGRHLFADAFNKGLIAVEDWVKAHVRQGNISAASLSRWQQDLKKNGLASLGGGYGNRKGTGKLDQNTEQRDFIIAMIWQYTHASPAHYMQALVARFGEPPILSIRSLQRWVNQWKKDNERVLLRKSNPDAYKNKFMLGIGSYSEDVVRLNQRWELDSTPADVMLADGRHSIIGMIDVFSRRVVLHVCKTSSADGIVAMLRKAIMAFGVPECVKIDNGKDYISKRCLGIFTALGIEEVRSEAFSGWQKPHVERFFGTFNHGLCELLPNFKGHNVADAQALRARESFAERLYKKNEVVDIDMTAEKFQTWCDNWVKGIYMIKKHSGLGMSPMQKALECKSDIKTISNERALDMLLAPVPSNQGRRSVTKKGISIKWKGEPRQHWYSAPCLADVADRGQVIVRFDPVGDMGRVYVFYRDAFLGIAECPQLLGIDLAAHASESKKQQSKVLAKQKKAIDTIAKDMAVHSAAAEIMEKAAQAANTIVPMPKSGMEHQTSHLDAAVEAIEAEESAKKAPIIAEPSQAMMKKAEAQAKAQRKQAAPESAEQRFAKYQAIVANPNASNEEKTWAEPWAKSPEGVVQLTIYKLENES